MEIEDEHEELKAVRRNCEKLVLLVSSSSSSSDEDEETTTISNCLRSLRALFSREKRSLAEGVFTSAFVSLLLLTMCLCRPWRLCFFLSLSLSLSLFSSFFCSPHSSSLMFALSSHRHHFYRNRCICNTRKVSSLYWKYGTRTI